MKTDAARGGRYVAGAVTNWTLVSLVSNWALLQFLSFALPFSLRLDSPILALV